MEYYGKALTIKLATLGPDHSSTASTYNNVAIVYNNQYKSELALEYYGKALAINIKLATLGPNHKSTGDTYYNMANLSQKQADYPQALALYTKALIAYCSALGEDHSESVDCREEIASVKKLM